MISALISFPACGLTWVCDACQLEQLRGIDLDKPVPEALKLMVLGAADGRGVAVHPRYLSQLLGPGTNTLGMVRAAALRQIVRDLRTMLDGADGNVPTTPMLSNSVEEALAEWLPFNSTTAL